MKDVRDALFVAQRTDGTIVRRPLSPHLGIYRFQLSMFLSIANRISGVASSFGTLLLVWWLVAAAAGPEAFATVQRFAGSWIGLLMLLGWTASLFYHLFGGLRHLVWDAGYGFERNTLNPVTWVVLGLTAAATAAVWAVGLSVW